MTISNSIAAIIPTIFAQGLSALRNRCVLPSLINNSYSTNAMEKGQTISIPIPSAITTNAVVPGPYAPDSGSIAPTAAQITLSNWQEAAFTLNEQELGYIVNGYTSRQITAAISALADYVNQTIFNCYNGVNNVVGTAGTIPFSDGTVGNAVDLKETLTLWKTPYADRRLVLDTTTMGNALKLQAFAYMLNSNDPSVMREGDIGRKFGFDWYEDQQVPRHISGTITTGLTANSTAGVAGAYTFNATTAAASGACALLVGDVIKIAGHTRSYALTANATQASSSSVVSLIVNAPLQYALVGTEAITVVASHTVNLGFHADAFGFASRTMAPVAGAEPNPFQMDVADPVSGLTLRLQVREEFHRIRWAFDLLWGVSLVRPDLSCRLLGA